MNKLTIVFAGKIGSQKSLCASFALVTYLNFVLGKERFELQKTDTDQYKIVDCFNLNTDIDEICKKYSVKIYNCDDTLKSFAIDHLGLDYHECYGSDEDRQSISHIEWSDIDENTKYHYAKKRLNGSEKLPTGFMKADQVLSVVDSIFRKIDLNSWSRGLYKLIEREGKSLAIIRNAMYGNEVSLGGEMGAKTIRLMKSIDKSETELDSFPLGNFDVVLSNQRYNPQTTFKKIRPILLEWFKEKL